MTLGQWTRIWGRKNRLVKDLNIFQKEIIKALVILECERSFLTLDQKGKLNAK
jgi:hypothetical protein